MDNGKTKIPAAVIRRLPRYYRCLAALEREGAERTSSQELAQALRLTASQVRQDLNRFGGFGQQGYGYHVRPLREGIGAVLGVREPRGAVLLGAGNLGRAILKNFDFEACGFRMLAAFDVDPAIVGTSQHGVSVYPLDVLEEFTRRYRPSVAVLTLPASGAEEAASRLASLGYGGIWNFTGADLSENNRGLAIENVNFADSLMALRFRIK